MSTENLHTKKKTFDATALVVLAIGFVALMVVVTFLFRGMRLDLTQNQLYTIAPGTKQVLAKLDEPINLYFFFSQEASRDLPGVRAYAQHVRELLEEMAQRSKGKLHLTVVDPQPFSDDEDRATQLGLAAVPVGAKGQQLYFGLAGTNSTDGKQIIGFFQKDKEEFLEYDVASLVYRLAHPKRPIIALMTTLPMEEAFDQASGRMREGWAITSQLRELFTLRTVTTTATSIDADIDVLMVVHPKNLAPATVYAIDQFVLRGGKLLAFIDPSAELDMSGRQASGANRGSNLEPLLQTWGVDYDPSKVVGDQALALSVSTVPGQPPSRHLGVLSLPKSSLNKNDVATAKLESINMMTVGALKQRQGANTTFEPLLTSSKNAALIDAARFAMLYDPQILLDGFVATGESYAIAARVHGKFTTAFPGGAPASEDAKTPAAGPQLKESAEGKESNIVIVADTDMLADMLWLRPQNVFGQQYVVAWANNGDFIANVLDNLTGSSDLISVRGRQSFLRPFTRVDKLRQHADQQLRTKEQALNKELQETEAKLSQLQASRKDQSSLSLSPEQEAELNRFQQERGRVRKELRDVRRSLNLGIESLGNWLKALNIGFIPLLLSLAAVALAMRRKRRLRMSRSNVGIAK